MDQAHDYCDEMGINAFPNASNITANKLFKDSNDMRQKFLDKLTSQRPDAEVQFKTKRFLLVPFVRRSIKYLVPGIEPE
jgi:hypothetical protein